MSISHSEINLFFLFWQLSIQQNTHGFSINDLLPIIGPILCYIPLPVFDKIFDKICCNKVAHIRRHKNNFFPILRHQLLVSCFSTDIQCSHFLTCFEDHMRWHQKPAVLQQIYCKLTSYQVKKDEWSQPSRPEVSNHMIYEQQVRFQKWWELKTWGFHIYF